LPAVAPHHGLPEGPAAGRDRAARPLDAVDRRPHHHARRADGRTSADPAAFASRNPDDDRTPGRTRRRPEVRAARRTGGYREGADETDGGRDPARHGGNGGGFDRRSEDRTRPAAPDRGLPRAADMTDDGI